MSEKSLSVEVRRRLPRVVISLVVVFFLYFILDVAPGLVEGITMPGINIGLNVIVRLVLLLITFIFLARILIDVRVLTDKATDPIVKLFGIREEKTMKRVAKDIVYIIIVVLVFEAVLPLLANLPTIGDLLGTITGVTAFGILFVFAYDAGRTLYDLIISRADDIADWLTESSNKLKGDKKTDD